MTGKNPAGRPATEEARRRRLYIYVTEKEEAEIKAAAEADGTAVTAWVRQAALKRARREGKSA